MTNNISGTGYSDNSDKGSIIYIYLVSCVAAVGGLLFGFDTGVISGAIPFITGHFNLNAHQEGFAASNIIIGCVIGASAAGVMSDSFGRKRILILSAMLFIISAVYSALAGTYLSLIIARLLGGLAVGAASVLSPMYIAEISPASIRGRLVSLNQLTIVAGILLTCLTNWLLVDVGPDNWRWMFAVEVLPAGLFLIALFFVPESPRWLIKMGRTHEAEKVLRRVGGSRHAAGEMKEIQSMIEKEEGSIKELFQPGLRKALFIGILLSIFASATGIDTIVYYTPTLLIRLGYESASSAILASVMVGVTLLIFTVVAIFTIDRFGRKILLLIGAAGMGVSFALAGYSLQSPDAGIAWVLIPILAYVGFFAMSMGPVVWVLLAEIYPNKIRGTAMSIVTMILWGSNFFVIQTFPWLVDIMAEGTFYMYAGVCFIALVTMWYIVRETKGKTLEEIEKMWVR